MGEDDAQFDLRTVLSHFLACPEVSGDVDLRAYVAAYKHLNLMFPLLGRLFSFISTDIANKVDILEAKRNDADIGRHYTTLVSMVSYEQQHPHLLTAGKNAVNPGGCRTLLRLNSCLHRLHRALEFVISFMTRLAEANIDATTAPLARTAYDETLSKHHPWLIRQAAHLAFHALPIRSQLLLRLGGENSSTEDSAAVMQQCVAAMRDVYDRVETLYKQHELLSLP